MHLILYQDALDQAASLGVVSDIWVAHGEYYPDDGLNHILDQRDETFQLLNGVSLYGGLAGTESPSTYDLNDRIFYNNETVLNGDIGVVGNNSDNSYHVVTGSGTDSSAVLNGFTITNGNANISGYRDGGGIYNNAGAPTITNW